MPVIIADRNLDTGLTFNPLLLECGWKGSIVEVADTLELIHHFILSRSCIVLLDEEFLGNNTNSLGLHLKEINPKSCLVSIRKRKIIKDKKPEPFIDYLIVKNDPSKKIVKIIQNIIDEYGKSDGKK